MVDTTKVWRVNSSQLVIADTIEEAIKVYKSKYEFPYNEVTSIEAVNLTGCISSNNNAFIKRSETTVKTSDDYTPITALSK